MSQGKLHSFLSLLEDVDVIEIPVIQRDYAQGRTQAADIRDAFLAAIGKALKNEGPALDLDFIYGSVVHDGLRTLSVLDGQQRLTTLFLLHWYMAALDGELEDFRQRLLAPNIGRSKFTYATRPSAAEFFQALVSNDFVVPEQQGEATLSEQISDARWFFDAWRWDPTVRSCLVMLDAINEKFRNEQGFYHVLREGRVTFHYLELRDFGLSDDLYIKMNARGKALTPFENFKAWLVNRIIGKEWADKFTSKLDQQWVDFFWTLAGRDGNKSFDDLFLRFFYLAAYFEGCARIDGYWTSSNIHMRWIQQLRDAHGFLPLRDFEVNSSLDANELAEIMEVLDFFAASHLDGLIEVLQKALQPRADYYDLLQLYAIVAFLRAPGGRLTDRETFGACFQKWLRVTGNLIRNTRIDEPSAAVAAIKGLTSLAKGAISLYEMLANETPTGLGFARDQIEEESRKATLILQDQEWEQLFIAAESHWYLQGRVRFLIKLSAVASSDPSKGLFRKYTTATEKVVTPRILESEEFALQRALLSLYDFLPMAGEGNHTFCVPRATAYRDRAVNWLPVFEDARFQQLLDAIGEDGPESLKHLIQASSASGWRALMVKDPEVLSYCKKRLIRKSSSDVFLLSKARLTGYFAEARSYALYLELRRQRSAGILPDLKDVDYIPVYGDNYPGVRVRTDSSYLIQYCEGLWSCFRDGKEAAVMPELVAKIALDYSCG